MGKAESIEQKKIRQKELARQYISSDEVDQDVLEELNRLCKPIYLYIYNGYHIKLPHMDRDDYLLIGYITLWRVLEKCREKPDIINSFNEYLFSSVRNAYAAEFRKYVMKNPLIRVRYEEPGGSYNISSAFFLADNYLKKDREKAKRYYHNHIDEIKGKMKEKLIEDKESAFISKEIATIYRDVPLNVKLEDIKFKGIDDIDTAQTFKNCYIKVRRED